MNDQCGASFFEILIALLVFVSTMTGLMTQQWFIVRTVHHMQADLNALWDRDNQDESKATTVCSATSNKNSKTPHSPCGHLLPMLGE